MFCCSVEHVLYRYVYSVCQNAEIYTYIELHKCRCVRISFRLSLGSTIPRLRTNRLVHPPNLIPSNDIIPQMAIHRAKCRQLPTTHLRQTQPPLYDGRNLLADV